MNFRGSWLLARCLLHLACFVLFSFQVVNVTGISVGTGLASACDTLMSQVRTPLPTWVLGSCLGNCTLWFGGGGPLRMDSTVRYSVMGQDSADLAVTHQASFIL